MEIDDHIEEIEGDSFDRAEYLTTIDELSRLGRAEWEKEMGKWVVPLIESGSWLAGANIIASGVVAQGKVEKGGELLKKPGVPAFFLRYIGTELKKTNTSETVLKKLESNLLALQKIAQKKKLSEADVKSVQTITGEALDLL